LILMCSTKADLNLNFEKVNLSVKLWR